MRGPVNYAIAKRTPSRSSESAYSIWKTRRGASFSDLDEAWTKRGLMAITPPRPTQHSTSGADPFTFSNSLSSSLRVCEFGITRKGPFDGPDGSRWILSARILARAEVGAWEKMTPHFSLSGPQPLTAGTDRFRSRKKNSVLYPISGRSHVPNTLLIAAVFTAP